MKAHERLDCNDSPVSNELYWSLLSMALVLACAVLGILLGEALS